MNLAMRALLFSTLFICQICHAQQWGPTAVLPFADRYDDIYFETADLGWTVSGQGKIFKTEDGGDTWIEQFSDPRYYFRAVDFINEDIGFVGTLDSLFLKTEDGGETWTDIKDLLAVPIKGICGLDHVGDHVFGVGVWSYPAYFIKSTNQGKTWTHTDLSDYANGLVDCHFIDENVGFVAGVDENSGGVILKTTDGGDTWNLVMDTQAGTEYIWKLDFVNSSVIYGAIESFTNPTRIVKSVDGGDNWEILQVVPQTLDIQGIGFIDENVGWVGPRNTAMYQTNDGGQNWEQIAGFRNINRYLRISPDLMYASGHQVYKYEKTLSTSTSNLEEKVDHSILAITPNPFNEAFTAQIKIDHNTFARLDLFDASGRNIQNIHAGRISSGEHQFKVQIDPRKTSQAGAYFLVLRTNEGFHTAKLFKQSSDQ